MAGRARAEGGQAMTDITPTLLTAQQAAQFLAVSERTIWNLVKDGRLPAVRFGRILRIDRADLDAFIQACKGVKR